MHMDLFNHFSHVVFLKLFKSSLVLASTCGDATRNFFTITLFISVLSFCSVVPASTPCHDLWLHY